MKELLSAKEVAKILGISQYTVLYTLAVSEIKHVKVCNKKMFRQEDVEDYIKRNTVKPVMKFKKIKRNYVV